MYSKISHSNNLEQILVERILSLFIDKLGHQPEDVYCRLLDNKLTIVIENAITKPEKLLIAAGYHEIVEKARNSIEKILRPEFQKIIEEVTNCQVSNILFATHLDTNYVSIIALFVDKYELTSTKKAQFTEDSVSN
ncbi:MAG: Na-translocating system protein MpsC family protein [Rivularia sp. (in: cyanobacteria)]